MLNIAEFTLWIHYCVRLSSSGLCYITRLVLETKIAEFANSIDLDEVAHNEPPHLDLHCLPSSL